MANGKKVITFTEGWTFVQECFNKVTNHLEGGSAEGLIREGFTRVGLTCEDQRKLPTIVYTMCTQDPPNNFTVHTYEKYKQTLQEYLNSRVLPAVRENQGELMLKELVKRWSDHKVLLRWFSRSLEYIDRFYVLKISVSSHMRLSLSDVGMKRFRDLVYDEVKVDVKDAVIAMISRERKCELIDRALLKSIVEFFVEIGMGEMEAYETDFETFMLQDTGAFYKRIASSWIQEISCPEYMIGAEECLKQEMERVGHYLHPTTEPKLLGIVRKELLSQFQVELLAKEDSGCRALLRDGKVDDLSRMYALFSPISKELENVAAIFRQHVTDEGDALVKQATDDAARNKKDEKKDANVGVQEQGFVQKVLDLHDKYLGYVAECFGDHSVFYKALKEAFKVFCNKGVAGSTSAELLASFCDSLLKKGESKTMSDEAMENTLVKAVKLLAYVHDKDLFAEFCRKKLARRLLFHGASKDHEKSFLMKMKDLCGAQFTLKMDGMLTDIQLASENQSAFQEYLRENEDTNLSVDLSVTILTTIKWPSYKTGDLTLPIEMVKCIKVYQGYYETKTNERRKLTWMYSLGSCNMIGKFDAKPIELIITTYQAAILMLFNDGDRLSYNDIKNGVNLRDDDIVRLLHSLSCAKYKILIKHPDTKMVGHNDSFEFNTKFTDKMRRIKIPVPIVVDEKSKKPVQEVVEGDRRYSIDACVVKIMKKQKQLPLQQLIIECVDELSKTFKPDVKVIKRRIEDLMERDFLKRDIDNQTMLKYIA